MENIENQEISPAFQDSRNLVSALSHQYEIPESFFDVHESAKRAAKDQDIQNPGVWLDAIKIKDGAKRFNASLETPFVYLHFSTNGEFPENISPESKQGVYIRLLLGESKLMAVINAMPEAYATGKANAEKALKEIRDLQKDLLQTGKRESSGSLSRESTGFSLNKKSLLMTPIVGALVLNACSPAVSNPHNQPGGETGPIAAEVLTNEERPEPQQILLTSFKDYEKYRADHPELKLGELKYVKPENYLEVGGVIGKMPTIEGIETNDKPGSSFIRFSIEDIKGPKSLMELNPGSGILNGISSGIKDKFGADPYQNPDLLDKPEVQDFIKSSFSEWFNETENFILEIKKERKATMEDLITHFLIKNDGDIMKSLWDTTLFLKVAARNNPDDLSFGPQIDNVKFLARNIKDDFSKEPLSDVLKQKLDPYNPNGIVPRAGILYHNMNDITLEGCMAQIWVDMAVRSYYVGKGSEEGQDAKMEADLRITSYGDKIADALFGQAK